MKIVQEHKKCIGCNSCVAVCPKYWEVGDDGKSKPKKSKLNKGNYEVEIVKVECNQQAADACPVQCIIIMK